jgi:hypothetical protein
MTTSQIELGGNGESRFRPSLFARVARGLAICPVDRFNSGMRHTRADDLDRLEPLLAKLRRIAGLKEKSRGAFYRGPRAFLHFHADGDLFFADVRLRDDFERLPATTAAERKKLLDLVVAALADRP